MSIPRFSVNNRILANMITVVILVGGIFAARNLRREVFPRSDLDIVVIQTLYPSASPSEVEDLITIPIEDELRDVNGIDEHYSSSLEGMSSIVVKIDPDERDPDRVITDIQRKVDQVTDLPAEAEDPVVQALTTESPVVNVVLSGLDDEKVLRDYADQLKTKLEQIPHVSSVARTGWRDQEYWVELDPGLMAEQEISISQVMNALARRNVNLPGGRIPMGTKELILRTVGKFYTPGEVDEVIVRSNIDGKQVTVSDLGQTKDAFEENMVYASANGTRAIILGVKKKLSGDTIRIVDRVKQVVVDERTRAPQGIRLDLVDDESFYVKRRLAVLTNNGLVGFLLVVIVLLVFLNFRVALLTAVGIPFSMLAALMLMSFFGFTLNMMTMFGMIIVLGMLVDDALIVGENSYRHLEMGEGHVEAAVRGAEEVMYPVMATVLTTIAAFVPLIFAPDMYGKFLRWLTWVVVLTLGASLFEALFILPSHFADFVRPPKTRASGKGLERAIGHAWMSALNERYVTLLRLVLRRRYVFVLLVTAVFLVLTAFARYRMRLDIFPADMIDVFMVKTTAPQGTSLSSSEDLARAVERKIAGLPASELENVVTYVGQHIDLQWGGMKQGSQYANIVVYLTPQETRERRTQTIMNQVREDTADLPGFDRLEFEMIKGGPPAGRAIEFRIRGPDFTMLQQVAEQMKDYLGRQPGVSDVQDDFDEGKEEVHVVVDEDTAARLGVDVETVARTVYAAFEGAEATAIRKGKDEVKVRVRLKEPWRSQTNTLSILTVPNRQGRLISLDHVARFERTQGLPTVFHYNGDRVITVSASVDAEITSSAEVSMAAEKEFADIGAEAPGCGLMRSGEWRETSKVIVFMVQAFVVALLVIYTILAVQFQSLGQPLLVMVSIPLGFIGVILALILHNQPLSMMAMMGMVGLAGVVVNDAIVLVDFINAQRRSGMSLHDAILDGCQKRLRPILLTSVTTIAGLMPTIYGWGGYEPFIVPAAITLAFGLLFATFLTLVVVPVVYFIGHDVSLRAARLFGREIKP